jgi:hypothetical protein
MNSVGQNLWDYVVALCGSANTAADWSNTLAYPVPYVDEENINEMVQEKFNGYNGIATFGNGVKQYKMTAKPIQNKATRGAKKYVIKGDHGESYCNIIAHAAGRRGQLAFNLHVNIRKKRVVVINVVTTATDGGNNWITPTKSKRAIL